MLSIRKLFKRPLKTFTFTVVRYEMTSSRNSGK